MTSKTSYFMEKKLQLKESNELAEQQLEGLKAAFAIVTRLEAKVATGEQDAVAAASAHADEKYELEANIADIEAIAKSMEEETCRLSFDLEVANEKAIAFETELANHKAASATEKRISASELATTNAALNTTRAALGNVTETLSTKLFVADTERDALKAEALVSVNATEKLTAALSATESERDTIKVDRIKLRSDLEDTKKAVRALNSELESSQLLAKQVPGLERAAKESDAAKAEAAVTISAVTKERDALNAIVENVRAELEASQRSAQLKIEGLNAAVQSANVEKAEALTTCKLHAAELATLKPQLAKSKMVVAKVREELEDAQLEAAAATVAAGVTAKLHIDLEAALNEAAASKLEVESGKQQLVDINLKFEASSEAAADVMVQLQADISAKMKASSSNLTVATSALQAARDESATAKSQLHAEREDGKRLTQEVEGLNVAFQAASAEMAKAVASSELRTAELTVLKPKLAKAKADVGKIREELEDAKMATAAATGAEEAARLLAELADSREETAAAKMAVTAETQQLVDANAKLETSADHLAGVKAALQVARDESAVAKSQIRAERADGKLLLQQVESLTAAVQAADSDKAEALARCSLSTSEFRALKYRFDELQADVAKVVREELGDAKLEAAEGHLAVVTLGLQAARDESATAKSQILAERKDSQRLAKKLTEAEADVARVREDLEGAQLMLEAASGIGVEVTAELQADLEATRIEAATAKLEIKAGKKLLADLLAKANEKTKVAHDQTKQLEAEVATLKSQVVKANMDVKFVLNLKAELESAQRMAREANAQLTSARDNAAAVDLELALLRKASETQTRTAAASYADMKAGLETQLAEVEATAKSTHEAITEALKEKTDNLYYDLEKANGKVGALEIALTSQQTTNDASLATAKAALSDAWSVSANSLESLTARLSATKKERNHLKADAGKIRAELDTTQGLAQQQVAGLKTALAAVRAEKAEAVLCSKELEGLKPQLVDAKASVANLIASADANEAKLAEVRAETVAAKQATAQMAIKMAAELQKTHSKLVLMEDELSTISNAKQEVERLRRDLAEAKANLTRETASAEAARVEASSMRAALASTTLDTTKKPVSSKSNAFGRLAEQLKSAGRGSAGRGSAGGHAKGIPFASVTPSVLDASLTPNDGRSEQGAAPSSTLGSVRVHLNKAIDPRILKVMDALNVDQDLATALLDDVIETGELSEAPVSLSLGKLGNAHSPVKADRIVLDHEALASPPRFDVPEGSDAVGEGTILHFTDT